LSKPENIFYKDRARRRVALAGLTQPQPVDEEEGPVNLTFRSPVYIPPELQEPKTEQRRVTSASDVWSLGLLLYQM
jgi:serine/threonine protein kinase